MEVQNTTAEKKISIRDIRPLTPQMLDSELSPGTTLKAFLSQDCPALAKDTFGLYTTKNYSWFRHLEENRPVNEAHVLSLMESFEKDGYLFTVMYVNERLEIIDGQHRFEAAKRCGLPVYFMIMPGWGIKEVTILNMNSRNWTILNFMETHAKAGNPNYIRFKEFFDANEFEVTICQFIITGKRSRGYASTDAFRLGHMQVDDQLMADAWLKANRLKELRQFHPQGWKSRNFVEAMITLFNARGYDHAHMVLKLTTYPEVMLIAARSLRVDEYLRIFLEKYNFRRMKDKIEVSRR